MQLISFWLNSTDCQGPAQTMSISAITETLPQFLNDWNKDFAENRCGRLQTPLSKGCCKSNLESKFSFTTVNVADFIDKETEMPQGSNGFKYCYLRDSDQRWILEGPECWFGNLQCTNDSLWIFPSPNCQGTPTKLDLSEPVANASIQTIHDGSIGIKFIGHYPPYLLTPDKRLYSSFLSRLFYGSALIGTLIVFSFYVLRYSKGKTIYMLMYLISQCAWLGWIVLDYTVTFHTFPEYERNEISNLRYAWFGVCTFLNVSITANILLVFTQSCSRKNQIIATMLLFLLQIALAGELYLDRFLPSNNITTTWKRMVPGWVLFFYFFDIVPPVFIFWSLLNSYHVKGYKFYISILVLLQSINALWYISVLVISSYTTLLYSDKFTLAANGPIAFSHVFHSIVSCVLNHQMRAILGIVATIGRKSKLSSGQSYEFGSNEFNFPPSSDNFSQNLDTDFDTQPVKDFSYDVNSLFDFIDSTDSDDNKSSYIDSYYQMKRESSYIDSYYQMKPENAVTRDGLVEFKMGDSVRSSGESAKTTLMDEFIPPPRTKRPGSPYT